MKTKIATGKNNFIYRKLSTLPRINRRDIETEIMDFTGKQNIIRLKAGKRTFLSNSLKLS